MEVTQENFHRVLESFEKYLETCDLVALDLEFTGLNTNKSNEKSIYDLANKRYELARKSIKSFIPIQVGLCLIESKNDGYIARPYNFYVFSRPLFGKISDVSFLCQSASLDFLSNNNFDFNKWIKEGIPFMSHEEENKARKSFERNNKLNDEENKIPPNSNNKEFIDSTEKEIEMWFSSQEKTHTLPPANPYQRRLTYQIINELYKTTVSATTVQTIEGKMVIKLEKVTPEELIKIKEQKDAENEEKLQKAIGFRKIIDLLSKSRKPLVAHNSLLDFIHIYHRFVKEAPKEFNVFKTDFLKAFPLVMDTKLICSHPSLRELFSREFTLASLYEKIKKNGQSPSIVCEEGFDRYNANKYEHEAGYDAWITGCIFISLVTQIKKINGGPINETVLTDDELYPNKIYLMGMGNNNCYINLNGPDYTPDNKNVFYCCGFPSTTTTEDLQAHFSRFKIDFKIVWRDDTSAFIHFFGDVTEHVNEIAKTNQPFKTYPFTVYRSVFERKSTPKKRKRSLLEPDETTEQQPQQPNKKPKTTSLADCVIL